MKARRAIFLFAALALLGILASCTANGGSIYATIETEKKVVDSTLPKTLTVSDLVSVGGGVYYMAAGSIFKGTLSAAGAAITWSPTASDATRPFNPAGMLSNALALSNSRLWAGFFTIGTNAGLYQSDAGYSFVTAGASLVGDPAVAGKQVTLLQPLGANLFVVVAQMVGTDYTFEMYSFNGATWSPVLVGRPSTDAIVPISGIGYDGTTYWVASGTNVYSGTSFPLSTTPTASATTPLGTLTLSASDSLNSVFTDTTRNRVFIAAKIGGIYYKDGAAGWVNIPADVVSSATVSCLTVAGPVDPTSASPDSTYLVGTDGYGYYSLSVASSPPAIARFSDNTIALYTSAVRRILVDSSVGSTTVFMGTAGNGLWRSTFDPTTGAPVSGGTSGSTWVHE